MAVCVIGLLVFSLSQPSITSEEQWRPLVLQTVFASLFASLPFVLFDRDDYRERNKPVQFTAEGDRKTRKRLLIVLVLGGLMLVAGITAGLQAETWWAGALIRVGAVVAATSAVLVYQLTKTRPSAGTRSGSLPPQ
jgi:hypothetical protein